LLFALVCFSGFASFANAREIALNGHTFTLPDDLEIVPAVEEGLVERPICADFDPAGNLYVAESSGSNDKVEDQLAKRPHRLLRLQDTNGDGRYDRQSVFVDRLMLPQGVLWHEGSVYVAAPPVIWKFTDSDGDGAAEKQEVWFDGQTLTGCANDLHGPYAGRDGWLYWCKGAFAEQTYERHDGSRLVTRAAHIFRRRPDGGLVEPIMAGGMDNPVEVVFTPGGEPIFSSTFLQHPAGGLRDGLIHCIYGGLYGKRHSVIDNHPRTGPLMPPLVHLGPAAPCGLAQLEADGLGADFQGALLTCCFNLRKVACHRLSAQSSTFAAREIPFLTSDHLDFHPTDVLEDADGSVLVIDTGGWYKLCCPTSHLWKPDVLGTLYRVRRVGGDRIADPRGRALDWEQLSPSDLAALLGDARYFVRREAERRLACAPGAEPALAAAATQAASPGARTAAVWALCRRGSPASLAAIRAAFHDDDETVRQAAIQAASIWRDAQASSALAQLAIEGPPANRRAAAQALGRIGDPHHVPVLLAAAKDAADRAHEHAIVYALIEIQDPAATRSGLMSRHPAQHRAALLALAEMPSSPLEVAEVAPSLNSPAAEVREAAWQVFERRPDWVPQAADHLRRVVQQTVESSRQGPEAPGGEPLESFGRLGELTHAAEIQAVAAAAVAESELPSAVRREILSLFDEVSLAEGADAWRLAVGKLLAERDRELTSAALALLQRSPELLTDELRRQAMQLAADPQVPRGARVQALAATGFRGPWDASQLELLTSSLSLETSPLVRLMALDVLSAAQLRPEQATRVADALAVTGPSELRQLAPRLMDSQDDALQERAVRALCQNAAAESLDPHVLADWAERCGSEAAQRSLAQLRERIEQQAGEARQRMDAILADVDAGDPRAGLQVFHGNKAGCATCHAIGYVGGRVGPDLTHIGRIRSARDIAESILFPSASFVRSYEPTLLVLQDGRVESGIVLDENRRTVTLAVDAQKTLQIAQADIDERQPGEVSVMPTGLDKILSHEELRDLIALLIESK
jgi:putative membrane-bound dehydrogenase-like protein